MVGDGDAVRADAGPLGTGAIAPTVGPGGGVVPCGLATGGGGTGGGFGRTSADIAGAAASARGGNGAAGMADGGVIGNAGGAATGCGKPGFALVGRGGTCVRIGAVEGLSMWVFVSVGGPGGSAGVAACATDAGALTGCPVIGVPSGICGGDNATRDGVCGVGITASGRVACESRAGAASAGGAAATLRVRRTVAGFSSAPVFAFAGARLGRGVTSTVALASFFAALRRRTGVAGAATGPATPVASITTTRGLRLRGGFGGASSSIRRV
jgi:hypothetical protein